MKIYLESNGCIRRNSELIKLQKYFLINDYQIVNNPKEADYVIVSTCAFKEQEETYSLSRIRILKELPTKMLVIGCLPEIAPTKFGEFSKIDSLAPKDIDQIDKFFPEIRIKYAAIEEANIVPPEIRVSTVPTAIKKFTQDFELSRTFGLRTYRYLGSKIRTLLHLHPQKYYLSISRGCLGDCSYCAIRRAIGVLQSYPVETIVKQLKDGLSAGFTEFIILGDDVGAYGIDCGMNFPALLQRLIREVSTPSSDRNVKRGKDQRIRLHIQEIHPKWLIMYKQQLLDIIGSGHIASILCPIESGNDRILELMRRHYNKKDMLEFFQRARELSPSIELSTHVMIGFPTETEEEFLDSIRLVTQIHFDQVTVFPYDQKEQTAASTLSPIVKEDVIQRRLREGQKSFKRENIKTFLSCPE